MTGNETPKETRNMHICGHFLQGHTTLQGQSKEFNKQDLTPNSPFGVTHMSVRVYIAVRIGHRQQENIHFLQDGGDS